MSTPKKMLKRIDKFLTFLEDRFLTEQEAPDWEQALAYRWRKQEEQGYFHPINHPHQIRLIDLQGIEQQKTICERNTVQFLRGKPANNILLWGSRGTGKSSLIKALLNQYAQEGLRLIEVDRQDLIDLPEIVETLYQVKYRFIIFCDDLSFEQDDASYKALKSILDGSISAAPDNVLIYATSNRRHLMPEYMSDNLQSKHVEGELHYSEAIEEKISLSERFGIWLSFYPFKQEEYLEIVEYWLEELGLTKYDKAAMRTAALQWALARGSRSGRSAWQFARDWAGQEIFSHS
ncbi:ATP-binding protein [Candidatus Albibeggiatoa sp. nov. NOAA]|uniref:ATP-binding protein n=1 Tax=Candidatus Albibeggiatoa sp. nov. NOAA TaxID=3162724 RepID=UPI0032F714C0|nr:ATP-binding protein [Thiotrichaceae bacterium]